MKVSINFDLDDYEKDDKRLLKISMKSEDMVFAFDEIHNRVWRPYYKHGYHGKLQDLIDKNERAKDDDFESKNDVLDAIELLHEMYKEVLEEYGINDVLD